MRAFEATAGSLSFTRMPDEQNVTRSAISLGVRDLEAWRWRSSAGTLKHASTGLDKYGASLVSMRYR